MTERKTRTAAKAAAPLTSDAQARSLNNADVRMKTRSSERIASTSDASFESTLGAARLRRRTDATLTSTKTPNTDSATTGSGDKTTNGFYDLATLADVLYAAENGFVLSQTLGHDWSELTRKSYTCYGAWYCRNTFNEIVRQQQELADDLLNNDNDLDECDNTRRGASKSCSRSNDGNNSGSSSSSCSSRSRLSSGSSSESRSESSSRSSSDSIGKRHNGQSSLHVQSGSESDDDDSHMEGNDRDSDSDGESSRLGMGKRLPHVTLVLDGFTPHDLGDWCLQLQIPRHKLRELRITPFFLASAKMIAKNKNMDLFGHLQDRQDRLFVRRVASRRSQRLMG